MLVAISVLIPSLFKKGHQPSLTLVPQAGRMAWRGNHIGQWQEEPPSPGLKKELEKQAKQVPPTRLPMEINYRYGNEGNPKDLSQTSTTAQKGWEWEASQ